jgi:hypothetical protein
MNDFMIGPLSELVLEAFDHPEAQLRAHIRLHMPTLIVLGLLEKIANAVELDH